LWQIIFLFKNSGITGIVLAGGKSSRMGTEKGLSMLKQKPLISYAIKTLKPVCNPIIIAANTPNYKQFGHPVVLDIVKNVGPLGGILSGLHASNTADNIVLTCDMPLISADLIRYILSEKENYKAVVPVFHNLVEPLCAFYHQSVITQIHELIKNKIYKMQEVVTYFDTKFVTIEPDLPFYRKDLFVNINSPADLKTIKNRRI
jgi:molybdopterin-guanine dinucleotide biosynthesis protein A